MTHWIKLTMTLWRKHSNKSCSKASSIGWTESTVLCSAWKSTVQLSKTPTNLQCLKKKWKILTMSITTRYLSRSMKHLTSTGLTKTKGSLCLGAKAPVSLSRSNPKSRPRLYFKKLVTRSSNGWRCELAPTLHLYLPYQLRPKTRMVKRLSRLLLRKERKSVAICTGKRN